MMRRSSSSVVQFDVPAARTTFSSSITEPTSFPPNRRPICRTFRPCVTQLLCTLSMLSRNMRLMARVLRYSTLVASSQPRPPRAGWPGWKLQGMKAVKAPGLSLQVAHDFEVVHALFHGFADAEHHGRGGPHAERVSGAMNADPVFGAALEAGDALADFVVEDLGAAAGDGVEAGVAEARDGGAEIELRVFGDGEDFGGRET